MNIVRLEWSYELLDTVQCWYYENSIPLLLSDFVQYGRDLFYEHGLCISASNMLGSKN